MTNVQNILAALALVAISSTVATAQTDFGSTMGAGSGAGGTIAPFAPEGLGSGVSFRVSANGQSGFNAARSEFAGAQSATSVTSPAGGTEELSAEVMRALAAVLGGSPTAAEVNTLTGALAGAPNAASLVASLQTFGGARNGTNLAAAITSYNAAIDGVPTGTTPPAVLAAIRFALFAASKQ